MKMDPLTNLQVLTNSQLFVLAQLTGRESFFLFYLTAALNAQVVTKTELKRSNRLQSGCDKWSVGVQPGFGGF